MRFAVLYSLPERARCIDFFHMSSGWFDCTEPSQTTSLQGRQGVQGALCTGSRLKHIEPHRTFSIFIHTEIARYIEVFLNVWGGSTGPNLLCLQLYRGEACRVLAEPVFRGYKVCRVQEALPVNRVHGVGS